MNWMRHLIFFLGLSLFFVLRRRRRVLARALDIPQPQLSVCVHRSLPVPMPDGTTLIADHYFPATPGRYPTILIRSPYGRSSRASAFGGLLVFIARLFTERGYNVLVQDVRGRFDSGGVFEPYFNERADGQATIDWIRTQPWYNGKLGMWGGSYLGLVQWVLADNEHLNAISPSITGSNLHTILYPDGAFDLGLAMRWLTVLDALHRYRERSLLASIWLWPHVERSVSTAFHALPVVEDDHVVLGRQVPYYRFWLAHPDENDELWQEARSTCNADNAIAPAHLVGGWYDFFLRAMLEDYQAMRERGRNPYLTIGPWHHFDFMLSLMDFREGLTWFDAHLKGNGSALRRKPVRVYHMGANQWRELDAWPPPATDRWLHLHAGAGLYVEIPAEESHQEHYRYDPLDPTPAVGGTMFSPFAGRHRNNALESRADVLTFTTEPLTQPLDVMGHVWVRLYVKSSLAHTDFFARVCDVDAAGGSYNVCDGLIRLWPGRGTPQPDGSLLIDIDLWATAHRFLPGHAVRLQISSGAHPRWTRNLGTGEPLGTGTTCHAADQTVFMDRHHPSALLLPVVALFE